MWRAEDKLRDSMVAVEYKHVVLVIIFPRYISDAFKEVARSISNIFFRVRSTLSLSHVSVQENVHVFFLTFFRVFQSHNLRKRSIPKVRCVLIFNSLRGVKGLLVEYSIRAV